MGLIGLWRLLLGLNFDHAAHLGGLITGLLYSHQLFNSHQKSSHQPKSEPKPKAKGKAKANTRYDD